MKTDTEYYIMALEVLETQGYRHFLNTIVC